MARKKNTKTNRKKTQKVKKPQHALIEAIKNSDQSLAIEIIKEKAASGDFKYLNFQDKTGNSPIHYAAKLGLLEVIEQLVYYKQVKLDEINQDNLAPIDYCYQQSSITDEDYEIARILVGANCKVDLSKMFDTILNYGSCPYQIVDILVSGDNISSLLKIEDNPIIKALECGLLPTANTLIHKIQAQDLINLNANKPNPALETRKFLEKLQQEIFSLSYDVLAKNEKEYQSIRGNLSELLKVREIYADALEKFYDYSDKLLLSTLEYYVIQNSSEATKLSTPLEKLCHDILLISDLLDGSEQALECGAYNSFEYSFNQEFNCLNRIDRYIEELEEITVSQFNDAMPSLGEEDRAKILRILPALEKANNDQPIADIVKQSVKICDSNRINTLIQINRNINDDDPEYYNKGALGKIMSLQEKGHNSATVKQFLTLVLSQDGAVNLNFGQKYLEDTVRIMYNDIGYKFLEKYDYNNDPLIKFYQNKDHADVDYDDDIINPYRVIHYFIDHKEHKNIDLFFDVIDNCRFVPYYKDCDNKDIFETIQAEVDSSLRYIEAATKKAIKNLSALQQQKSLTSDEKKTLESCQSLQDAVDTYRKGDDQNKASTIINIINLIQANEASLNPILEDDDILAQAKLIEYLGQTKAWLCDYVDENTNLQGVFNPFGSGIKINECISKIITLADFPWMDIQKEVKEKLPENFDQLDYQQKRVLSKEFIENSHSIAGKRLRKILEDLPEVKENLTNNSDMRNTIEIIKDELRYTLDDAKNTTYVSADGKTVLTHAIENHNFALAKELLRKNYSFLSVNNDGTNGLDMLINIQQDVIDSKDKDFKQAYCDLLVDALYSLTEDNAYSPMLNKFLMELPQLGFEYDYSYLLFNKITSLPLGTNPEEINAIVHKMIKCGADIDNIRDVVMVHNRIVGSWGMDQNGNSIFNDMIKNSILLSETTLPDWLPLQLEANNDGQQPIHLLAKYGIPDLLEDLSEKVDVDIYNILDINGKNAIDYLQGYCKENYKITEPVKFIQFLEECGVSKKNLISCCNHLKITPPNHLTAPTKDDQEQARKEALKAKRKRQQDEEKARKRAKKEKEQQAIEAAKAKQREKQAEAKKERERQAKEKARKDAIKRKAEQDALEKKAKEEAKRKKILEELRKRKAEQKQKALEEEQKKKAAEEAERKKILEEARQKREIEKIEQTIKAAEEAKRQKALEGTKKDTLAKKAGKKQAELIPEQQKETIELSQHKKPRKKAKKKSIAEKAKQPDVETIVIDPNKILEGTRKSITDCSSDIAGDKVTFSKKDHCYINSKFPDLKFKTSDVARNFSNFLDHLSHEEADNLLKMAREEGAIICQSLLFKEVGTTLQNVPMVVQPKSLPPVAPPTPAAPVIKEVPVPVYIPVPVTVPVEDSSNKNNNLLGQAIIRNDKGAIESNLNGSNINQSCTAEGELPITLALQMTGRDSSIVDMILNHPQLDINKPNKNGQTPLFIALSHISASNVQKVLSKSPDLSQPFIISCLNNGMLKQFVELPDFSKVLNANAIYWHKDYALPYLKSDIINFVCKNHFLSTEAFGVKFKEHMQSIIDNIEIINDKFKHKISVEKTVSEVYSYINELNIPTEHQENYGLVKDNLSNFNDIPCQENSSDNAIVIPGQETDGMGDLLLP